MNGPVEVKCLNKVGISQNQKSFENPKSNEFECQMFAFTLIFFLSTTPTSITNDRCEY